MQKSQDNQIPPVVSVLGHVDHGKTTLLDEIRKTSVAKKETGGITQGIGASVVNTKEGKDITFIDTPGHSAFEEMRKRGADVCDIAVLVVASEEGVKPQTKEAIKHIKGADIPVVIALTKCDLPSSDVDIALSQLEKEGIMFEGRGGDTPFVEVSARTGTGIDKLLEIISLVWEMNKKTVSQQECEAVVIETRKTKAGIAASVIVRKGILKTGDVVWEGDKQIKIRGLFGSDSKQIKQVSAGYPVLILGFSELPEVGSKLTFKCVFGADSKQCLGKAVDQDNENKIKIIVKADTAGSLEAVLTGIEDKFCIVSKGVGDLVENDVFLAKDTGSVILAFRVKVPSSVANLTKTERVEVESFDIIYKLFEHLDEIVKKGEIKILGKGEIVAEFPFDGKKVAGVKIVEGRIAKSDLLILQRKGKEDAEVKIISIKKQKNDIDAVASGEECGIIFEPQFDFSPSDVLLSIRKT